MMVAYSLMDKDPITHARKTINGSSSTSSSSPLEGAALFTFAILGGLGNVFVMIVTLMCPKFRNLSSAFLFHHCLLDAIKSVFCLPFGYSLLMNNEIRHCDVLGAAYMLLMTVSAYNLLALLLNEEYRCSYLSKNNNEATGDTCCIIFGIVIIWFTTVLLHLGVAFLPGNSEFSKDIGNCVYRYGITKNYVIHVLWVLLVSGAIVIAAISFFHFYRKLSSSVQSRKWAVLHKSLSSLQSQQQHHNHPLTTSQDEEVHYHFEDDKHSLNIAIQIKQRIRRLSVLFCMLVSFVVCWYPLFFLTLFDLHYQQPAQLYRILTIFAWVHPLTTPVFCAIIYYNRTGTQAGAFRDVYTNAIPMTTSKSSHTSGLDTNQPEEARNMTESLSFRNYNFNWDCNNMDHHTSSSSSTHYLPTLHTHSGEAYCDIATNYSPEEEAGQTLIM